ncbi:unnamed protein product [Polarella glacialis]|uniref:Beta-glucosidase n=1 Tax=Polarella glacialis TaxID=89957 RepID=A0A813GTG2_POLGL|nr:unnamed protein product [Polarella glacialis]
MWRICPATCLPLALALAGIGLLSSGPRWLNLSRHGGSARILQERDSTEPPPARRTQQQQQQQQQRQQQQRQQQQQQQEQGEQQQQQQQRSEVRSPEKPKKPLPCATIRSHPWCDYHKPLEWRVTRLLPEIQPAEMAGMLNNNLFGGTAGVTRLGIPGYNFVIENSHGLTVPAVVGLTVLPQVIGTAASFNKSLYQAIGEFTASQARSFYEEGFTPGWNRSTTTWLAGLLLQNNINIFRDPRWGRGQETPGEDPVLNAAYERQWVQGIQARKGPRGTPLAAASCKHFDAYSFEGGPTQLNMTSLLRQFVPGYSNVSRHNFDAQVSAQDLKDTFEPAFEACIKVNGVPMCGNRELEQRRLMRDSWGFDGIIVTDCDAVADMFYPQQLAATGPETVTMALGASTNVFCSPGWFEDNTRLEMHGPLLKESVRRTLRVRFELGEFDPPPGYSPPPFDGEEAERIFAKEAAVQSAVLLKNEALLGAFRNATWELAGNYASDKDIIESMMVSPLRGLEPFANLLVPDVPEQQVVDACSWEALEDSEPPVGVAAANSIVIVAGIYGQDYSNPDPDMRPVDSAWCKAGCLEAEGCDRPNISLPTAQRSLIEHAVTWGPPVVLVIIGGGAVDLEGLAALQNLKSILWMGFPGQEGGSALGALLFGDSSPSARLTQTFYKSSFTEATSITDMRMRPEVAHSEGRERSYPGRSYRFVDPSFVMYPFGFGLSYQPFTLSLAPAAEVAHGADSNKNNNSNNTNNNNNNSTFEGKPESWACCAVAAKVRLPHNVNNNNITSAAAGEEKEAASFPVLLFLSPPSSAPPWAPRRSLRDFSKKWLLMAPRGHNNNISSNNNNSSSNSNSSNNSNNNNSSNNNSNNNDSDSGSSAVVFNFQISSSDFQLTDGQGDMWLWPGLWRAELNGGSEPLTNFKDLEVTAHGCKC